jgi:hypothetical protein
MVSQWPARSSSCPTFGGANGVKQLRLVWLVSCIPCFFSVKLPDLIFLSCIENVQEMKQLAAQENFAISYTAFRLF